VTLSDLGFDLSPKTKIPDCSAPRAEPPLAVCAGPTSWASAAPPTPTCWAAPCSPAAGGWHNNPPPGPPGSWGEHPTEPSCSTPIMRTGPCMWGAAGTGYEASQRSPHRTPTASGCNDHGAAFRSWLQASGLPPSGVELAEQLRVVAPEAYED
jgi:hypothetical protein